MEERNTCPKPTITAGSRAMLGLFSMYENRVLPFAGGILNQPQIYMTAMEVIVAARDEEKPRGR